MSKFKSLDVEFIFSYNLTFREEYGFTKMAEELTNREKDVKVYISENERIMMTKTEHCLLIEINPRVSGIYSKYYEHLKYNGEIEIDFNVYQNFYDAGKLLEVIMALYVFRNVRYIMISGFILTLTGGEINVKVRVKRIYVRNGILKLSYPDSRVIDTTYKAIELKLQGKHLKAII